MADTLTDYQRECRRLLHDANANYFSDPDLADYINEARRHVATDTGCLRTLYNIYLTGGQENYVIGQACGAVITNAGSGYSSGPTFTFGVNGTGTTTLTAGKITGVTITNADSGLSQSSYTATLSGGGGTGGAITVYAIPNTVVDIVNITLLWGNQRIQLTSKAFSDLSAFFRPWVQYQSIPAAWAWYGTTQIYVAPNPNIQYQTELDTCIIPPDITPGQTGSMVGPALESVKYWAGYLAYTYAQQDGKAKRMEELYIKSIQWAVNMFTRRLQSAYLANANVE